MTIQTLVVTTGQKDHSLVENMNLQTDAIIGNQCNINETAVFDYKGCTIEFVSYVAKGVGRNRNEVLMRAIADICVLADDDMIFDDGYGDIVSYWFEKLPDADILIFNLREEKPRRHSNNKVCRINFLNYAKYGAARMAFRTKSICLNGIFFHTMFGGGCEYSCGEDTIFLRECLRKGLKVYGVPQVIAKITDGNSTWFSGYTDKYFFDKGVLYYVLSKRLCHLHILYHVWKYRKRYQKYGLKKAFLQMWKGIKSVKR